MRKEGAGGRAAGCQQGLCLPGKAAPSERPPTWFPRFLAPPMRKEGPQWRGLHCWVPSQVSAGREFRKCQESFRTVSQKPGAAGEAGAPMALCAAAGSLQVSLQRLPGSQGPECRVTIPASQLDAVSFVQWSPLRLQDPCPPSSRLCSVTSQCTPKKKPVRPLLLAVMGRTLSHSQAQSLNP